MLPLIGGCGARSVAVAEPPPVEARRTDAPAQGLHYLEEPTYAFSAPDQGRAALDTPFVSNAPEASAPVPAEHPLRGMSQGEIKALLQADPEKLGSISIGNPSSGRLVNGVQLPEDRRWVVVDASHAYGTRETVQFLEAAVAGVHRQFPDSARLHIGHISGKNGGRLSPHRSHQSGRDVDVGFYYVDGEQWYRRATKDNLDLPRTWALVRAFVVETDVRFILLDHRVQALLREYALEAGEDPAWIKDLFDGTKGSNRALIRHEPGHATHMHVRFYNPIAQESARLSYASLVELKLVEPPTHFVYHRVKKGETLIHLARRYGTSVKEIKRANRLRSNKIIARKSYKIPRKGPAATGGPLEIPPRRYPPDSPSEPEQGS